MFTSHSSDSTSSDTLTWGTPPSSPPFASRDQESTPHDPPFAFDLDGNTEDPKTALSTSLLVKSTDIPIHLKEDFSRKKRDAFLVESDYIQVPKKPKKSLEKKQENHGCFAWFYSIFSSRLSKKTAPNLDSDDYRQLP